MQSRKLVVVKTAGKPIQELNGVVGPVNTPVNLSLSRIRNMIVKEKLSVYECNPLNPIKDQTKLTKDNYNKEIYSKKKTGGISATQQTVKKNIDKIRAESSATSSTPISSIRVSRSDF